MDAVKYLKELKRMCSTYFNAVEDDDGGHTLSCADCPLSDNGTTDYCSIETEYPEETVAVVEKWSREHPKKTMLSDFLEKYPNVPLATNGTPFGLCPHKLGFDKYYKCEIAKNCVECWNRPLEED